VINVAYCLDKNYQQHFGASILSLLLNFKGDARQLRVFVVADEVDKDFAARIDHLSALFQATIQLTVLNSSEIEFFENLPEARLIQFSKAIYYRLHLASILPNEVDKVLYIDCDTIILDSIHELFKIDLQNYVVAGVPDIVSRRHCRRLGTKQYINSGVMLMNLSLWREKKIADQCYDWLNTNPDLARLGDQCAINAVNDGAIKILESKWNGYVAPQWKLSRNPVNPSILHFITGDKPWHAWYSRDLGDYYWRYLGVSPWKGATPIPPSRLFMQHWLAKKLVRIWNMFSHARRRSDLNENN